MDRTFLMTPLHDRHVALGAKMVDFAGWQMPLQYEGIVAEHRRCREAVVLFDISHMGRLQIEGPAALDLVQKVFTNDASRLEVGHGQYGLVCADDGGILDDVIVTRETADRFMMVVNAVNRRSLISWLSEQAIPGATTVDVSDAWAMLALQGPRARGVLIDLLDKSGAVAFDALRPFAALTTTLLDNTVTISRTGYTGGPGYEIFAPSEVIGPIWDGLLAAGQEAGLQPAGLGARDTLRLEAGYCLYGQDISIDHNPLEAGLDRYVRFDKPEEFNGRKALMAVAGVGPSQRLVGLTVESRGVVRPGSAIQADGATVGQVTSGSWSPTLERSIALGYVRAPLAAVGKTLSVVAAGRTLDATVTALPFYKPPIAPHQA